MKLLLALFIVVSASAFAGTDSPIEAAKDAIKAVHNLDERSFSEISRLEARCLFGDPDDGSTDAIISLKERFPDLSAKSTFKSVNAAPDEHFTNPKYLKFWSYLQQRFFVDISTRDHKQNLRMVVDCHYGTEEDKDAKWVRQKAGKYPKKECKVVKVVTKVVDLPTACLSLAVPL
jgi:hypothetical protein